MIHIRKTIVFFVCSSILLLIFFTSNSSSHVFANPINSDMDSNLFVDARSSILSDEDLPGFDTIDRKYVDRYFNLAERITSGLLDQDIAVENLSLFQSQNPFHHETILSFLVYPLSETKSNRFDAFSNNPQFLLETLNDLVIDSGGKNDPQALEKIENVGDTRLGFSLTMGQENVAYQIDFIWIRRGNILESVWLIYPVGENPKIEITQLAKLVDQNVQKRFLGTIFRSPGRFVPQLTTYIPTPLDISVQPDVIGTNLVITALLMLPFAAATELITSLLAEKESYLVEKTKLSNLLSKIFSTRSDSLGQKTRINSSFVKILRFIIVLIFYGIVFSLLEQNWEPFTITGVILFLNMIFAYGLVGIAGEIIQYRKLQAWNKPADLSLRPTNVFLSIFSSVTSRLIRLVPGLMFGTPKALVVDETQLSEKMRKNLIYISVRTLIIICFGFWALTIITNLVQNQALASGGVEIFSVLEAFLLVAFAVALENLFVELLGFPGGFGEVLRQKSRIIWLLALSVITFIFYHSLINPRGDLSEALNESKVWVLHGIVSGFIIFVFVFWLLSKRKQQKNKIGDQRTTLGFILWSSLVVGFLGLAIIGAIFFTRTLNRNDSNLSNFVERIGSDGEENWMSLSGELDLSLNIAHNDEKICFVPEYDIYENLQDLVIWQGIKLVASEYGAQSAYLQPGTLDDHGYQEAIDQLLQEDCTLIVGNGSHQVTTFSNVAEENPDQKFLVLDGQSQSENTQNLRLIEYNLNPGFYIAGYLSAAISDTESVGVFSYRNNSSIPSNMDCFVAGVSDFDKKHQADVSVQGWDVETQEGVFVTSDKSPDEGYDVSTRMLSSGVDVILPLAGIGPKTTSYGAAKSAQDYEDVYMIGYQLDWARITPEFSDVVMTSVIKRFDQSIALAFAAHIRGDYVNGDEIGSISSGEIQLTPLRGFKDLIPIDFMAELTQMQENSETLSCFVGESMTSESVLPISTVMPTITLTPTLTPTPTSTSTPRPTPTIDKGVYNPDNGHWYRIVNTSRTFNGANYYCRQLGAHLVTISEESENQFVFNLYPYTWLGATDEDSEGGWRWITGEPWTYTSWADGEPNNLDGIEHFLHFKEPNAPLWNDIPNGSMPFICEWDE